MIPRHCRTETTINFRDIRISRVACQAEVEIGFWREKKRN